MPPPRLAPTATNRLGRLAVALEQAYFSALRRAGLHGIPLLLIFLTGAVAFHPARQIVPFQWDNLFSLTIANDRTPSEVWTDPSGPGPEYRPLALMSIWIQGQFAGLKAFPYLVFNHAIWIAAAMTLYVLVYRLSGSRPAAVFSGLLLLLDSRARTALIWIDERQTSMSIFFGLAVLVMLTRPAPRRWKPAWLLAIFALLLAASLSKEYGLVYSGAAVVWALFSVRSAEQRSPERMRSALQLSLTGAAALAAYLVIRIALAPGSLSLDSMCQVQSFFTIRVDQETCLSQMDSSTRAAQFTYNVGATLVGIPMPWLFTASGALMPRFNWYVFALGIPVCCLALFGLLKAPNYAIPLLSLVVLKALVSFMLYRPRNQLTGAAAIYACAGLGLAVLLSQARASRVRRVTATAVVAPLILAVGFLVPQVARHLNEKRLDAMKIDPCRTMKAPLHPDLVRRVKHYYRLEDPDCDRTGDQ